jgi:RES domain-containing protein
MMLPTTKLRAALRRAPLIPQTGTWVRAVRSQYLLNPPPGAPAGSSPQPLWPGGSASHGARFTPRGGPPAIYLASDPNIALLEVRAMLQPPGGPPLSANAPPQTVVQVQTQVNQVLDLTAPATLAALGTSVQELSGDWRVSAAQGQSIPTWELGREAHATGKIRALLAWSAVAVGQGRVLIVFPDLLVAGSDFLQVHDPGGPLAQRLP